MPRAKTRTRARREKLSARQQKKLDLALQQVESAELVRRLDGADPAFTFKHALTQDTAYLSLLLTRRRELHNLVGQAYEKLESSGTDEYVGLLAYHFSEAGDDDKTAAYSLRAARMADAQNAYPEAAMNFYRALGALRRLPDTLEYRRQRVDTISKYIESAWGATLPQAHFEVAAEGEALARTLPNPDGTLGDARRLARIQTMRAALHLARNEYSQVIAFAAEVLAQAKLIGDETLTVTPSAQIGAVLSMQGYFGAAEPHLNRARAMIEDTPDRWEWSWCVSFTGIGLAMRGQIKQGLAVVERAIALLDARKNTASIVQILVSRLLLYLQTGDMETLVRASKYAVEIAPATGQYLFAAIGLALQALAYSRLGNHAAAASAMQASETTAARIGGPPFMMFDWIAAARAEIALNAGDWKAAVEQAENAAALAEAIGGVFAKGWAARVWGQALAQQNDPLWVLVDSQMETSAHAFGEIEAVNELARTREAWGALYQRRGDTEGARRQFDLAERERGLID